MIIFIKHFQFSLALDAAGPAIDQENECRHVPRVFEGGVQPDVANKTIAVYTNPCYFGTNNFNSAQVNILVNPYNFIQPGTKGHVYDHVYNHVFAVGLTASMCAKTQCFGERKLEGKMTNKKKKSIKKPVNLNFFYNDIEPGNYNLFVKKCYPFCC